MVKERWKRVGLSNWNYVHSALAVGIWNVAYRSSFVAGLRKSLPFHPFTSQSYCFAQSYSSYTRVGYHLSNQIPAFGCLDPYRLLEASQFYWNHRCSCGVLDSLKHFRSCSMEFVEYDFLESSEALRLDPHLKEYLIHLVPRLYASARKLRSSYH